MDLPPGICYGPTPTPTAEQLMSGTVYCCDAGGEAKLSLGVIFANDGQALTNYMLSKGLGVCIGTCIKTYFSKFGSTTSVTLEGHGEIDNITFANMGNRPRYLLRMTTFPLKPIDYEIIVSITRDAGQHGTKILDHIVFELKPDREFGYIKTLDSTREVPRSTMLEISKNMRKILSLRFDPEQKVYTGRSLTFRISAGEQSIVWKNQGVETSDVVQNDVYDGILEMLLEYASKL